MDNTKEHSLFIRQSSCFLDNILITSYFILHFTVLDLHKEIGNFKIEKHFDALNIDVNTVNTQIDVFDDDTTDDVFQKFIYLGEVELDGFIPMNISFINYSCKSSDSVL